MIISSNDYLPLKQILISHWATIKGRLRPQEVAFDFIFIIWNLIAYNGTIDIREL